MALSFAWMFADTRPSSKELIIGLLLPRLSSKTIQKAVGVVGCVITPHNIFYTQLCCSQEELIPKKEKVQEALNYYSIESYIAVFVSFSINLMVTAVFAKGFYGTRADSIGPNKCRAISSKIGTYAGQFYNGRLSESADEEMDKIMGVFKIEKLMERTIMDSNI
ncbi:Natural resistance-associated macrophage protein 2 [Datura stramonium]|uniref:Natural resistance-associated macrophage protein 2 n=1 Tax=Datura stramonium TaxID=4076 RepID=A0ABS8SU67_DATST|nr:Natural resistance-associated macrophage protein 2 [Datura stramonium]